jgi:DNA-binding NarL/FixJ family response regulator
MAISVVAIDDDSLAMRGAIDTLCADERFELLGIYSDTVDLPPLAGGEDLRRVVLLADVSHILTHYRTALACVPAPYSALVMLPAADTQAVRQALRSGARGFISRECKTPTLFDAISAVGVGGIYLGSLLDGMLTDQDADAPSAPAGPRAPDGLTPRERDVLVMVAQGLTHKQIGTKLSLSKSTVDTYVHRVRQKVGSGNKADLTRLAIDLGLMHDNAA